MTEEKKKKKKLIKVEGYLSPYGQNPNTISFSLVSKAAESRRQAMKFMSCRDYLSDALHSRIHNKSCGSYNYKSDPKIDLDKLRLLVGQCFADKKNRKKFIENIFSAKRLLNFYEDTAGWDRSKITTVNHSIMKYDAWLITGPKEWMSYSNLLSIITLIFRIIGNHGPIKFENNEDIEKWFYNLIEMYEKERKNSTIFQHDIDLSSYLPFCWDKFYMIMKHHEEIFTEPMKDIFPSDTGVHSSGGIVQLCKCYTRNETLDKNMHEMYKKFKREKYRTMESDGTAYKIYEEFVEQQEIKDKENRQKQQNLNYL